MKMIYSVILLFKKFKRCDMKLYTQDCLCREKWSAFVRHYKKQNKGVNKMGHHHDFSWSYQEFQGDRPMRIGIGGPVGSGKTALIQALAAALKERYQSRCHYE